MTSLTQNNIPSLNAQSLRSLAMTDDASPALRACIHEFGAQIVNTLLNCGVSDPNKIRMAVHSCWMGAREVRQRNALGIRRSPVADNLDWLLEQQGAQITAATLVRVLRSHNMVIVPLDPSSVMVEASMATVSGRDVLVTKYEKHRRRLRAALEASGRRLWPQAFVE